MNRVPNHIRNNRGRSASVWSEFDACRYEGLARLLLSDWKFGNQVIQDTTVIAYCKVKP